MVKTEIWGCSGQATGAEMERREVTHYEDYMSQIDENAKEGKHGL